MEGVDTNRTLQDNIHNDSIQESFSIILPPKIGDINFETINQDQEDENIRYEQDKILEITSVGRETPY